MFLFQKIEELMVNYQDARYAIGEFVLHERSNLYVYTIHDIAERTYTSKATVVRFAKTLGYDGWKEFMKEFIAEMKYQEMHQGDVDANYPFQEQDSTDRIIENLKTLQMESLQDTADLMDSKLVEEAVSMLRRARQVVLFGVSPNIYQGELFRRKFTTIGKLIEVARHGEAGIMSNALGADDCAIIISYSGNNEQSEPLCHLPLLKDHEVSILGITSGGDNYLRRTADCVLTMSSKERLYTKISNFATEESISFILNVLFASYFAQDYQQNSSFKLKNAKILEGERKATLKEMQDVELRW